MMSLEERIEKARAAAEAIARLEGIACCHVDDWNQYGSFTLFAAIKGSSRGRNMFWPEDGSNCNLRPISARIRATLKDAGAHSVRSPKRVYEQMFGEKRFVGFEDSLIQIELTIT